VTTPTNGAPAARVRVTSPRAIGARSRSRRNNAAEIDAQTRLGEVYVQSLMRAQLRLAVTVLVLLAATVGLLPLVLHLGPVEHERVFGVPLPWLVLGVAVYPWMVGLAYWYVRRAERNEEAFEDLVEAGR
jgi:hypothetical protein